MYHTRRIVPIDCRFDFAVILSRQAAKIHNRGIMETVKWTFPPTPRLVWSVPSADPFSRTSTWLAAPQERNEAAAAAAAAASVLHRKLGSSALIFFCNPRPSVFQANIVCGSRHTATGRPPPTVIWQRAPGANRAVIGFVSASGGILLNRTRFACRCSSASLCWFTISGLS